MGPGRLCTAAIGEPAQRRSETMDLIWHGTASIEAICGQGRILFGLFVPLKGSPVDVRLEEFDGFSHIFVTHCHLDHVVDLPRIIKRNPDAVIFCTQAAYTTLRRKGVLERNLTLLRYGDTHTVNGFSVRALHGRHATLPKADGKRVGSWIKSPARGNIPYLLKEYFVCREKDECVFYQIEADGKTAALMGSLNLRDGAEYPTGADVLVLPFNGWEDNLPPAVRVIERLRPRRVLLNHYDETFPPVSPPVDVSPITQRFPELVSPMRLRKIVHVG